MAKKVKGSALSLIHSSNSSIDEPASLLSLPRHIKWTLIQSKYIYKRLFTYYLSGGCGLGVTLNQMLIWLPTKWTGIRPNLKDVLDCQKCHELKQMLPEHFICMWVPNKVRVSLYHIEMCVSYYCCWRGGWVIKKMLTVVGVLEPPLNWHSTWTTPNPTLVLVTITRPPHVRQESYSAGVPQLTYQRHNSAREIYLVWDTPPSPLTFVWM